MRNRPQLPLALVLSCMLAVSAEAAEPFARATIGTNASIVSGEQIYVYIDVFAPNYFTSPPQFPLLDIPNAVVTLTDERAQNLVETIDGVTYSGIRRTYAVVPETSGSFAIPPASITFRYAAEPGQSVEGTATIPGASFSATEAAGEQAGAITFAAAGLVLHQSFDRDPKSLKVGDALVRSVTIFAENTQSMMIPVPVFDPPQGMSVYAQPPVLTDGVTDEGSRGGSRRSDRVTYVANEVGNVEIPALSVKWFDTASRTAKVASLDAVAVEVAAAPAAADAIAPDPGRAPVIPQSRWIGRSTWLIAAALAALVLLLVAAIRLYPGFLRRTQRRRSAWAASEPHRFRRLKAALKGDDARATYHAFEDWTRCLGYRSISDWVERTGDRDLSESWDSFDRQLFEGPGHPRRVDTERLARSVSRARRSFATASQKSAAVRSALPQLNP